MSSAARLTWSRYVARRHDVTSTTVTTPASSSTRKNKYGATPTTIDGIRFDSKKEARRYRELRLLARAGVISDLELQPRYPIDVVELWQTGPERVVTCCGFFTADFRYVDVARGEIVVEDTKSGPTKTTAYRLRKRLVEAIHGIRIVEV